MSPRTPAPSPHRPISVYPLLGRRFGLDDIAAATLMVSTLTSFVTISLMLWLIRHVAFLGTS
ncbi:hypothetical protein C9J49_010165 [Halomonas sp. SL1]|nr:hypothetical protein C9J49_010165 [Halomonas sp. SL1]